MLKKIVFLDIDGVLNNDNFLEQLSENYYDNDGWVPYSEFCAQNVAQLNRILKETGASIVLSSSWRSLGNLQELKEILAKPGIMVDRLIDKTFSRKEMHQHGIKMDMDCPRWKMIAKWLELNAQKDVRFIVLDDDHEAWEQGPNFVWTDPRVGLTKENADHAIQYLQGNPLNPQKST